MASGAGADRMSTGMKKSFGKNIGIAARVKVGQVLWTLKVNKPHVEFARKALLKFSHKLPCKCAIQSKEIKE